MSGKLEGKIALVTGGAAGIGLATAQRFVKEGAYDLTLCSNKIRYRHVLRSRLLRILCSFRFGYLPIRHPRIQLLSPLHVEVVSIFDSVDGFDSFNYVKTRSRTFCWMTLRATSFGMQVAHKRRSRLDRKSRENTGKPYMKLNDYAIKRTALTFIALAALLSVTAVAQEIRSEFGVEGTGSFTKSNSGNGVHRYWRVGLKCKHLDHPATPRSTGHLGQEALSSRAVVFRLYQRKRTCHG